ncbi:11760_t:CDS:2, partial [Entrophospora sp. SA101]
PNVIQSHFLVNQLPDIFNCKARTLSTNSKPAEMDDDNEDIPSIDRYEFIA